MNNSKIALDSQEVLVPEREVDRSPQLRKREGELIRIIEAIKNVQGSSDWSTLKEYVFDGVVEKLEKDLLNEAKKDDPDKLRLASINGQFAWAKKYADLTKLLDFFRLELTNTRKQLHG